MNILFTPIGLTDPISNMRDGAFLNICRFYDIDKVYIYMSKEVYEYHLHDNRYLHCLDMLAKMKNREIKYKLIIRQDLTDVHIFDYFIDEFRAELIKIHEKYPDANLYLNVSSGTPAMKSALQILAAFREFDMIPIQVATPEKRSNPHIEEKINYNPVEMWECNDDNITPQNRCSISKNINFLLQIKKQMLTELINKYDYVGAKALVDTMKNSLNQDFVELLDAATYRYKLNHKSANLIFKQKGFKLLEVEQSNHADIIEYFLLLEIKRRKEEYLDFIRAITPILVDLYEEILFVRCNFTLKEFTNKTNNIKTWNIKKLERRPELKILLDNVYNTMRETPVYSDHLVTIISSLSPEKNLIKICNDLRTVEKAIRNPAAHEIIAISDEYIKQETGFSSKEIIKKLKSLLQYTKIKLSDDFLNSYDKMNEILIKNM